MASASSYFDDYLESLKNLPVDLQQNFTLMRNIDSMAKEQMRNIDKLSNDFMSKVNVVSADKKNKTITKIQRQFDKAKECSDDKVKLAEQSYDLVDNYIKQLDLELAKFTEEIHDRRSGAKNIERGVQQVDGIWNKPSTSREEETTSYKMFKKKKIQKEVAKPNITAPSKASLVSVIQPTKSPNNVANVKVETGTLNGAIGDAGVAQSSEELDIPVDSNELTYCLCKQVSYGRMIACDNSRCPIEWFHFGCVKVTAKPKGKWFCPKCKTNKKKK